jgi:tetratricopeptide (TPR) repeat protein
MLRRIAFSMTIDPEGAMHDWVDVPAGWELVRVPTQEAVVALGPHGYRELLVDVARRERPHVFVAHPPYDHLTIDAADQMRAAGTRVVAYAFDDDIFAGAYGGETWTDLGRIYDRYVTTREVRWATRPLPALVERPPDIDVVLVGRAYARRRELVAALAAAGVRVEAHGAGWDGGFVSRADMLSLYARAAIVLTTADWEHWTVPMVKHRLLDTAMVGAFQVAQAAPDLRGYFPADEVPSFASPAELVDVVRAYLPRPDERRRAARAARARAAAEHTWSRRLGELLAGVPLRPPDDAPGRSVALDTLVRALASRAEIDGRVSAAAALWEEAARRDPADAAAAAGVGRCLRDLGRRAEAIGWLRRAIGPDAPAADAIQVRFPAAGAGTGLGRSSALPVAAEPLATLVAALVELGRADEACVELDRLAPGPLARGVAAALGGAHIPAEVAARLDRLR